MKRMATVFLALVLTALASGSQAKDVFYYLGYEVIQVIDGATDAIVADIPVKGWTRESGLTADKKFMYVTANRHLIHKVDLAARKVVKTVDVNGGGWDRFIFGFDVAADGKTAYAGMMSRSTKAGEVVIGAPVVAQVDLQTGKILRSIEVPWGVASLTTVKGDKQVYAIGKDLYKIDVAGKSMKVVETWPMYEKKMNFLPFWNYAWENGGVFMANYYTPELMGLLAIDKATGEIKDTPLQGVPVFAYSVIYSPDKKKAYGVMDELNVIDLEKNTYGPVVVNHEGTSYGVNVSSDGTKVYMAGGGSTTTVYDTATLKPIKVLHMASDGMDLRRVTY
jgi:DNA-binding beta-propeller fold protein YncE